MAKIEIPDKLYKDIKAFCELNDFQKSPEDYCVELLREKYYLEKYGDLNENYSNVEQETEQETEQEKDDSNINESNVSDSEQQNNVHDEDYDDVYDV